jgi:hypothetical protein
VIESSKAHQFCRRKMSFPLPTVVRSCSILPCGCMWGVAFRWNPAAPPLAWRSGDIHSALIPVLPIFSSLTPLLSRFGVLGRGSICLMHFSAAGCTHRGTIPAVPRHGKFTTLQLPLLWWHWTAPPPSRHLLEMVPNDSDEWAHAYQNGDGFARHH